MGGLLARSCRNRNGANERDSSTKGSTKSLGMLAQTFGKAFQQDLGKHAAGTNVSRKSLRWDWRPEANLNRKANGLALEGPSVGLYVPLLEFNQLAPSLYHVKTSLFD